MRKTNPSKRSQGGQAIVMFTLMVWSVLIPIVGLAIDGGRGYLVRLKLSSAVDGGALAAARLLGTGSNASQQSLNATTTAREFVTANFPAGFFGANLVVDASGAGGSVARRCIGSGVGSERWMSRKAALGRGVRPHVLQRQRREPPAARRPIVPAGAAARSQPR